jgi:hypothetical protein
VESIAVPQCYSGHTPDYEGKLVLAVEVRYQEGYERHIVKVGQQAKVAPDFSGWQKCTQGRMVASRIFTPVRYCDLPDNRCAVVYRDGFTLFGPDELGRPHLLEDAVQWAVMDDRPDPLSAERAIAHLFTDLGLWFFPGACDDDPEQTLAFYAAHLRCRPDDDPKKAVLPRWDNEPERRELRRHAVWVLAGRDPPDADPVDKPARYLDPADYVRWVSGDPSGKRLPPTLIGRSHGDLHARNVLVGVRRGEVEYPAVFDYGEMSNHNVLAWDFAKLETELKARLLPVVCRDEAVARRLREHGQLRPPPEPLMGVRCGIADRADRLALFLAFEELLDDLTMCIQDIDDAERISPARRAPTGIEKLDRLTGILLRVRKEAAIWLGLKPHKRQSLWKDEVYFALAVYGLLNVRWDYTPPQQEAALVSAGVAVARMPSSPKVLRSAIEHGGVADTDFPSYRVPLAITHRFWQARQYHEGKAFVEKIVLAVQGDGREKVARFDVRPSAWHALPLIGEAALMEMEVGRLPAAEQLLEPFRPLAREFRDYETLGRIGRLFKDAGDKKWESATIPFEQFRSSAGWQMYQKALSVYEEAFLATDDWYTGINAATLALLTHDFEKAKRYAKKVADTCSALRDHEKKVRYWLFATEGEAAIIRGEEVAVAVDFYRHALNELSPGQWGMANSSYKQACRLWKALGEDRVGPVLDLFETSEVREDLSPHFLGRSFPGAPA